MSTFPNYFRSSGNFGSNAIYQGWPNLFKGSSGYFLSGASHQNSTVEWHLLHFFMVNLVAFQSVSFLQQTSLWWSVVKLTAITDYINV